MQHGTCGLFWCARVAIVFSELFGSRACHHLGHRDEGRICKVRFSARNVISRSGSARATDIAVTARDWRVSGFVRTANTTARIAVKRATFTLRILMTTDSTCVVCRLDRDPRLVVAVRSAVHFQAGRAGLNEGDCDELGKAFEDVCREALLQLTDADGELEIIIDTFADRIEISIRHRGQQAPAAGLENLANAMTPARESGRATGKELLEGVDRVMSNSEGGTARTTLVKFLQPNHGTMERKGK